MSEVIDDAFSTKHMHNDSRDNDDAYEMSPPKFMWPAH